MTTSKRKTKKKFERLHLAAKSKGISTAFLRKLIGEGRLTRYKLGSATLVDTMELERLIVADGGAQ